LKQQDLVNWFNSKWKQFAFDTDRRQHKSLFPQAVEKYAALLKPHDMAQAAYFTTFMGTEDAHANFRAAWKIVRDYFFTFARLSAFSCLEYPRIMGLHLDCDQLFLEDMSGRKFHRNGLAIALGRDDLDWHDSNPGFNGKYSPETPEWLKEEGAAMLAEAKQRAKGKPWSYDVS